MISVVEQLSDRLDRLYRMHGEVDAADLLDGLLPSLDDESLAELIDADARIRLDRGLPVDLDRYLSAVPGLERRPVALDAAIEFSLRWLGEREGVGSRAADQMVARYPHLESAIRAASLLGEALWATSEVRELEPTHEIKVPCDFGPFLPSGQQRYEIRELLGRGAQGTVFRAVDRHLSDPARPAWVAIKVLKRQIAAGGRSRLVEEATRARRVTHGNVVRVLDRGVTDDALDYIVYEYVQGVGLRQWMQDHGAAVAARHAAQMLVQIARGVQAAHSVGILHCDLKPDNVLVTEQGELKVADFGLAVRLEESAPGGDGAGPVGNLGFTAPEQYRLDENAFAVGADIYALGGVLYYLLTGEVPNGQSVEEVEHNLSREGRTEAPNPRRVQPKLDRDLAAICRRALAPDPAKRYASAEALANDLESYLRHEPISWASPSVSRQARLFVRRQPLAAAMAVLTVAAIAGASAIAVNQSHKSRLAVMQERIRAVDAIAKQNKEWYDRMSTTYTAILRATGDANTPNVELNWITVLTFLEALSGPHLVTRDEHWQRIWHSRIEKVQRIVDEPRQLGRSMDVQSLMWETVLGFFLLREHRIDEAEEVLRENRRVWAEMLKPDDPHLTWIDRMSACGEVIRVMLMPAQERRQPETQQKLRETVGYIEEQDRLITPREHGNALHRLMLECLRDAYSADMLDRPADRSKVVRRLREFAQN